MQYGVRISLAHAVIWPGSTSEVGAAPHPPAGTFSPYSDGEKGTCLNTSPARRARAAAPGARIRD
ncbi:MAG: hypothetical protein E5W98_13360 [Mesorhizobium sp.]|nr:MAG: hypothetical protein EOS67_04555 [Mesorhizobium sp.]TKD45547.1 MAG: hypothetical protein E5W98_13360 [Mesorhizobium sp.]